MNRGRITAVFRPDERYTRHSEGAFLRLRDGAILFAYSRFSGTASDNAHSEIVGCVSRDEGETWSEARVMFTPEAFGAINVMSVSMLRMQNGDLGLFLIAKASAAVYQVYLCRSSDEGKTFYSCVDCLANMAQGCYVLNNDRVIRLTTGRLVMPLAYHRSNHLPGEAHMDGRAVAVFVLSDDDGRTWREAADTVSLPFTRSGTGLQEPGVIERKD
ncbi:MAG: exo-alpha-sialidase [Clostridia bacterium]|nr:exo-alpha-sialidase [Clostridia bacterium]